MPRRGVRGGAARSEPPTRIAVYELARIVQGRNRRRKLYGRDLGYWIRVAGDMVRSLGQQYQPLMVDATISRVRMRDLARGRRSARTQAAKRPRVGIRFATGERH